MKKQIVSLCLLLIVLVAGCKSHVVAPTLSTFQQLELDILSMMNRHQLTGLTSRRSPSSNPTTWRFPTVPKKAAPCFPWATTTTRAS
ncbi:hypothetical protein ACWKW6_23160 [Dyadobacter jiangsuensis]